LVNGNSSIFKVNTAFKAPLVLRQDYIIRDDFGISDFEISGIGL
jgi:hypothetical protein